MIHQNKRTRRRSEKTLKLVQIAMLAAIEILLSFTALGYLKIGILEITFMTIPVAIAATTVGPLASAVLGLIFGISSFVMCFGMSAFGVVCLSVDPLKTAVLCIGSRLLMGIATGYIYQALKRTKKSLLAFTLTSFSAAALNTLFFVLGFFLLFRQASLDLGGGYVYNVATQNFLDILVFLAGVNALVEIPVCTILSTAIGKALARYLLPALSGRTSAGSSDCIVCPHCNATFHAHGEHSVCPYCGLEPHETTDR